MLITEEMIDGFNDVMVDLKSPVRLKMSETIRSVHIILNNDDFIESYIINLNKKFYSLLEDFFKNNCGLTKIEYNNTGSVFWSYG